MKDASEFIETRKCVCDRIRKAGRMVTQHYEESFRGSGLRATQFTMLTTLLQTGPLPVSRLAQRLGVERTTLTRNLNLLVERELIHISGAEDARVRIAEVTGAGRALAKQLLPRWQKAQASVASVLAELKISLG